MSTLKDFVEYSEDVFFNKIQDVNGIKVATELFIESYRKNNFINSELITLLQTFYERMKKENLKIENEFLALLTGAFVGLTFSKFSTKINIQDYET